MDSLPLAVEREHQRHGVLRHGVGRVGVERRLFVLRHLLYLSIQLRGRSLVDATCLRQSAQSDCLQHAQHAGSVHIGRELRNIKADLHMALGRQVINFVRAHRADHSNQAHRIAHIAVMQVEMRVALQMGNAFTVVNGRTTDDAMYIIALLDQKL